jgi:hypothetical protein
MFAGLLIATGVLAFPIHDYPGLMNLMEQTPDIVLIRINERVSGDGQTYDTYNVTVLHTFKGTIPMNTSRDIALAHIPEKESWGSTEAVFQPNERYLVFLEPNSYPNGIGSYRNKPIIGSCWKLRPDVHWEPSVHPSAADPIDSLFESQGWNIQAAEPYDGAAVLPGAGKTSVPP